MSEHVVSGLRLSDAERHQAATALGEHFAQGRLDLDEHAQRLEGVWAARTYADLAPLFADLPGGTPVLAPQVAWSARQVSASDRAAPFPTQARRSLAAGLRTSPWGWVPVVAVVLLGIAAISVIADHFGLVLLLGLAVFVLLRRGRCRGRRRP